MKLARLATYASLRGALLFAAFASFAAAQNQTWVRQFGTNTVDYVETAAPDGSGGVYLAGETWGDLGGPNAGQSDIWLARCDVWGNLTWARQSGTGNADILTAIAPDGAGGVFVSGHTLGNLGGPNAGGYDAWLAHYDGAGNRTWVLQFGTSGWDQGEVAAPDDSGGVYVAGGTEGDLGGPNGGGWDAWLAHYDSAGNQTWVRQFGTPNSDVANAAASDGAGGVYVSGSTGGSLGGPHAGSFDAWLAHYDGAGNQTWIRQFGSSTFDRASAAAPDMSGGVYVSGATRGNLGGPNAGDHDAWLAHYDSAGNQTWVRQFGTPNLDVANAAASDGAGGVYVSGSTGGSLGGPHAGSVDAWLAHYDGAGNQLWVRQFGTLDENRSWEAAADGSGGVYVSGTTRGDLGGPNAGTYDAWVARYDGDFDATRYCLPPVPNSTGSWSMMTVSGSNAAAANDITLRASQLAMGSFGFFLTSQMQGFSAQPGGSQGNLCLDGAIGRYVGPGQVQNSGGSGIFELTLDLAMTPTPTGLVQVAAGETWNFQAWHRDSVGGMATSNFTDAVSVTFQ